MTIWYWSFKQRDKSVLQRFISLTCTNYKPINYGENFLWQCFADANRYSQKLSRRSTMLSVPVILLFVFYFDPTKTLETNAWVLFKKSRMCNDQYVISSQFDSTSCHSLILCATWCLINKNCENFAYGSHGQCQLCFSPQNSVDSVNLNIYKVVTLFAIVSILCLCCLPKKWQHKLPVLRDRIHSVAELYNRL